VYTQNKHNQKDLKQQLKKGSTTSYIAFYSMSLCHVIDLVDIIMM